MTGCLNTMSAYLDNERSATVPGCASPEPSRAFDVVGVGFGPSNLALAVALEERNRSALNGRRISSLFLEKHRSFGWHRDMLIDGTTVQVSFLKDLVTLRTPSSEFSFLSYLHAKDRLIDFINHKSLFPSRIEFNDYFEWVAAHFADVVEYDSEVLDIRPVIDDAGRISGMDVVGRRGGPAGALHVHRTRNAVIATGLRPHLPAGVTVSDRVWHSENLLTRLSGLPDGPARRFVVVGAGQSAAEIVEYLHRSYSAAEVCAVFSRYGYSPADDSPFANRVFDPAAVDVYFGAKECTRKMILDYHANTNYSVVDQVLIDELYRRAYQEQVSGHRRLRVLNLSRVAEVTTTAHGARAVVESLADGRTEALACDAVIYATGYRPVDPDDMLGEMGKYCLRDDQGRLRVSRNYQVATADQVDCAVYVQGPTEHTHGLSSGLLSNVAVRAGEIARSVSDHLVASRPAGPGVELLHGHTVR
jgi:L-ornithine N5-monooxygenase